MVNEPSYLPQEFGWIEVICGGMFSGKTEELIRRARRAQIAGQQVLVIKPSTDNRYSSSDVVSHNETTIPSLVVGSADEIIEKSTNFRVICIDEAQFFDNDLLHIVNELANNNKWIMRVNHLGQCLICWLLQNL
jgi:thymidine kinase